MAEDETIRVDQRGFMAYDYIIDSYGESVRVKECETIYSPLCRPRCWVFVKRALSHDSFGNFSVSLEQAKAIRDALSKWIDDVDARRELNHEGD